MQAKRRTYNELLRDVFGCKVRKVSVDAGFTCPNRDGSKGRGGCSYCCNAAFTPAYCLPEKSVKEQIESGRKFFASKIADGSKIVAYFQSFTGTYAPVDRLRKIYCEAAMCDGVSGLVISTRPDCVGREVAECLAEINHTVPVLVELGVESSHDVTLAFVNRCHTWRDSEAAALLLDNLSVACTAHLILGLPGEDEDMMLATAKRVGRLPFKGVKLHQLQVLENTALAAQWHQGKVELMEWTASEYVEFCQRLTRFLPTSMPVERIAAGAPPGMLLYPKWGVKPSVINQQFDAAR